jgi:hypothetical protein
VAKKKQDLSNLTREEKMRRIDYIRVKKHRLRSRKAVYTPNNGQIKVHDCKSTVRAVFAGNGSGKTTLGVNEALWACLGYNPVTEETTRVPATVIVVLDKPDKIEKTWLPELMKWHNIEKNQLHKRGKPFYSMIEFKNGSQIQFMFHQQEPMSFESIELDYAIFDEPPPRHVYIALRRGARKLHSVPKFLIIGTPITARWLRTEIYEPWAKGELQDTTCFKYGTVVNQKNLASGYIEQFSSVLSEREKKIRLEGDFFDLEGLALAHLFDRSVHLVPPPQWDSSWPTVVAIDPHPNKNHVACLLGCDPHGHYYYLKEIASRSVPRDFARELRDFMQGYTVIDIVCDSLGSSPLTGGDGNRSFIEVLNDMGVRARATRYEDKKDEQWIVKIQEVLKIPLESDNFGQKTPLLRIAEDCPGIIHNIENVQWMKHRLEESYKPKLDISDQDYLACLKYALSTNLQYNKRRNRVIRTPGPVGWSDPRRSKK